MLNMDVILLRTVSKLFLLFTLKIRKYSKLYAELMKLLPEGPVNFNWLRQDGS